MATNEIRINVSDNTERVSLRPSVRTLNRSLGDDDRNPYYVGARAYVTQTAGGAIVTVIDKDGTTTATVLNGIDGNGIVSVVKTATVDLVDTYTITFDDGTTTTFDITNGSDAEVEALTNEEIEELLT